METLNVNGDASSLRFSRIFPVVKGNSNASGDSKPGKLFSVLDWLEPVLSSFISQICKTEKNWEKLNWVDKYCDSGCILS